MELVLGPDVFVNASVAPGTPPEQIAQRVLGNAKHKITASRWVLERVEAMLGAHPAFRKDHLAEHMKLIGSLVTQAELDGKFEIGQWAEALAATAKAAKLDRVITDHPDLLEKGSHDGVDFESTESLLLEFAVPPPPPPPEPKKD